MQVAGFAAAALEVRSLDRVARTASVLLRSPQPRPPVLQRRTVHYLLLQFEFCVNVGNVCMMCATHGCAVDTPHLKPHLMLFLAA